MKFLFGDSTDSALEFNYLAFLRDVIDCSVVLVEQDVILAQTSEQRRQREEGGAGLVAEMEALGNSAAQIAERAAKAHADSPVGRAAAAIVAAARQAVERESAQVRSEVALEIAQLESKDRQLGERSQEAVDRLLRAHDLPDATKVFEVAMSGAGAQATMRQTTTSGLDALIGLDVPASSSFGKPDLRVDRFVEGLEVSALEAGKWSKSDKLVTHKLARCHITRVVVGDGVSVHVEATDVHPAGLDITVARDGDITIDRAGGEARRDVSVDHQNRSRLKTLAEKLETEVRSLAANRTGLISFQIDGTPLAVHRHPRTVAEKLIVAMAPVVHEIRRHSPVPGELVLRVPLGDDRREEFFVSTAELAKRYDSLPAHGKEVFAPLQLAGGTAAQTPPSPGAATTQPPPPPAARAESLGPRSEAIAASIDAALAYADHAKTSGNGERSK